MSLVQNSQLPEPWFSEIVLGKTKHTEEGYLILKNDKHIGHRIESEGKFEYYDLVNSTIIDLVPYDGIIMNCGAMYGSLESELQKKMAYNGMIIAIEPGRVTFQCLSRNSSAFFIRTMLINAAVCDIHNSYLRHKLTDKFGSSLVTDWDHTGDNVVCMTIDGISKELCLDRINLIKIKCQGWEYRVLKGAMETISEFLPNIIMEINHSQLALHQNTWKEIKDLFTNEGYSWQIIEENLTEESSQFNILCKPKSFEDRVKALIQAQC